MKKKKNLLSIVYSILLLFFFSIHNAFAATIKKEVEVVTPDNFIIKATVCYPKVKQEEKFPTVVLLHSFGYNSNRWVGIQDKLIEAGYAWVAIDLRGHGKSTQNTEFKKISWLNLKQKAFLKYPTDVALVLKDIAATYKKISLNNWAIIGGDIGGNTGVLAAQQMPQRPAAIVLVSPNTSFKGLYIPVTVTELGNTAFLCVASENDNGALQAEQTLRKFAQADFENLNIARNGSGMMLINQNPELSDMIIKWLDKYLKPTQMQQ